MIIDSLDFNMILRHDFYFSGWQPRLSSLFEQVIIISTWFHPGCFEPQVLCCLFSALVSLPTASRAAFLLRDPVLDQNNFYDVHVTRSFTQLPQNAAGSEKKKNSEIAIALFKTKKGL